MPGSGRTAFDAASTVTGPITVASWPSTKAVVVQLHGHEVVWLQPHIADGAHLQAYVLFDGPLKPCSSMNSS